MSSADTNPVDIPQENPSPPPSPCPKKMAIVAPSKDMQQAKLGKRNNEEIEQKGDNDQREYIQDILNIGPGPGKTATLQAQVESSRVTKPVDTAQNTPIDPSQLKMFEKIDSKDENIQGKPDMETQGFGIPISTDTKPVDTPQKTDAALWKERLLQKIYSQAIQDIQNQGNEDRQAMDGQTDGHTGILLLTDPKPADETASKTPTKIQISFSSNAGPQPAEEAPAETPDEIQFVISLDAMKQALLEAKATKQKANTDQDYICQCCCGSLGTVKEMIEPQVQTTSDVPSYKDLTAKLRQEAKRAHLECWLPCKPASKKKVISTLIKSRQAPNLKLSDVHNVIAGTAKHLECKTFSYVCYEN